MLESNERRELIRQANRLKSLLNLGEAEPDDDAVAHVRSALERHSLLKIRIGTSDRTACERIATALARKVPCEFLKRIGRVIVLYRGPAGSGAA